MVGLLVFAAVWLLHLASTSLSPSVGNIEQLTWVRSLKWGYYRHPPLPTWRLWLPVQLFGLPESTSYLMGGTVTPGTVGVLWRLLKDLLGPTYATLAVLAALCITYYNGRLHYYNHNVVLLLAAYFSPSWTPFQSDRERLFSVIMDDVSTGSWTMGVARK